MRRKGQCKAKVKLSVADDLIGETNEHTHPPSQTMRSDENEGEYNEKSRNHGRDISANFGSRIAKRIGGSSSSFAFIISAQLP